MREPKPDHVDHSPLTYWKGRHRKARLVPLFRPHRILTSGSPHYAEYCRGMLQQHMVWHEGDFFRALGRPELDAVLPDGDGGEASGHPPGVARP